MLAGERTLLGQLAFVTYSFLSRLLGHFRGLVGPLVLRTPATDLAFVDDLLLGLDDLAVHLAHLLLNVLQAALELGLLHFQYQYASYLDVGR